MELGRKCDDIEAQNLDASDTINTVVDVDMNNGGIQKTSFLDNILIGQLRKERIPQ